MAVDDDVGPCAEGAPDAGDGRAADLGSVQDRTVGEPGVAIAAEHGDSGCAPQSGRQHPGRTTPRATPRHERELLPDDGERGRDRRVRARAGRARDPGRVDAHAPALVGEVERRERVHDRRAGGVGDAAQRVEHREVGDERDRVGNEAGSASGRPPQVRVAVRGEAVESADQIAPGRVLTYGERERVGVGQFKVPAKTCQASALFAIRLSTMYTLSPYR